jgi:hypothetical protein
MVVLSPPGMMSAAALEHLGVQLEVALHGKNAYGFAAVVHGLSRRLSAVSIQRLTVADG